MRHGRRWLALSCVVGLTGCTAGASRSASAPTQPITSTPVTSAKIGWARSDLAPVTQPYVAGGRFILYTALSGVLQVVALDPADGRTVWQATASGSSITPGVVPGIGVFGDTVTFLEPAGPDPTAKMVGVDGRSGTVKWTAEPAGQYFDWPLPCVDDPTAVCTTGGVTGTKSSRLVRFRAADGKPLPAPLISTTDVARQLGPDIFDPGTRSPEQLVAVNGATVAWRRPLASVFPLPGSSSDTGWDFDRVPALGLFVGSVGGPPVTATAGRIVSDLSKVATAGFRISDGTTIWRNPGSQYVCGIVHAPA